MYLYCVKGLLIYLSINNAPDFRISFLFTSYSDCQVVNCLTCHHQCLSKSPWSRIPSNLTWSECKYVFCRIICVYVSVLNAVLQAYFSSTWFHGYCFLDSWRVNCIVHWLCTVFYVKLGGKHVCLRCKQNNTNHNEIMTSFSLSPIEMW